MTYNVISYPTNEVDAEAEVIFEAITFSEALGTVADLGIAGELRPLVAHSVAALTSYTPMQAWELREQSGEKVALLAIQEAEAV